MRCPILDKVSNVDDLKKLKKPELKQLCNDLRLFITNIVSNSGGHLASSLGVVELSVALHYVFDSPKDKLIWDVGHQCYAHKILTGRKDRFHTIRSLGGLSGFPRNVESRHDQFDVGHASTSLSAGLGFAKARDLRDEDHNVISIIGDGALTGGMALEALNNIGYLQSRIIIILNDNKMSISENVGALSQCTSRITKTRLYKRIKKQIELLAKDISDKNGLLKLKEELKHASSPNFLFEKLGIEYLGPVDGHNLNSLIKALNNARQYNGPVLIHIKTLKGKGYSFAEMDSTKFHGVGKFNRANGKSLKSDGMSYNDVFGEAICRMAKKNKKIVAITAAMCKGTGLSCFKERFPERFFDVGIAEQHAVTFAAGLAKRGFIPVVAIYSTFLQRAYDQIIHDIALPKLPVIFTIDRAGLVGEDGPTHHGVFDISFLRCIPNMIIAAPKDVNELVSILYNAPSFNRPVAIRYPKEKVLPGKINFRPKQLKVPSSELLLLGKKCIIVAVGSMVSRAIEAANKFNKRKKNAVGVINVRFIKPLDKKIIRYITKTGRALIVEENSIKGGFGSLILEEVHKSNKKKKFKTKIDLVGINDSFITHGTREELLKKTGLDSAGIYKMLVRLMSR